MTLEFQFQATGSQPEVWFQIPLEDLVLSKKKILAPKMNLKNPKRSLGMELDMHIDTSKPDFYDFALLQCEIGIMPSYVGLPNTLILGDTFMR